MNFITKFKNYLKEQKLRHKSEDYVVLLDNFEIEDVKYVNQIFSELKDSPISIVASNEGSKEWSFLVSFKQKDDLDYSKNISDIMSPVLAKFELNIKKVWLDFQGQKENREKFSFKSFIMWLLIGILLVLALLNLFLQATGPKFK